MNIKLDTAMIIRNDSQKKLEVFKKNILKNKINPLGFKTHTKL